MHLTAAILMTLLRSTLIVAGLMGVLFFGFVLISEAGPSLKERLETPDRLQELEAQGEAHTRAVAAAQARSLEHQARWMALELRIERERSSWRDQLEKELQAIEAAAQARVRRAEESVQRGLEQVEESAGRLESEYCEGWNPINWMACRMVRAQIDELRKRADDRRQAVEEQIQQLQEQARQDASRHRALAEERLGEQTAQFEEQIRSSLDSMDELEERRRELGDEILRIQQEEAELREQNWLWIEFRLRWRYLLVVALLIFSAPFLRRTLWYYVGMPLVSRARPIQLATPRDGEGDDPALKCSPGERSLEVEVPAGQRLRARPGYIQSDRRGARSELFFDNDAPNLSYISGLVLLTRLASLAPDDEPRRVLLGTPDDPDAYLMRVDLKDHPGIVLKARHVVGVIGDVRIHSTWRLNNLHAWATSQVRFIIFSGTGTLIVEGYGDVQGRPLKGEREQKRMSRVVGFDTRLSYKTERTATFLPYLVDPGREPLVVDVFEGTGTIFFEKNPSARKRHRSVGEAVAGFFLDAVRRLFGL